MVGNILVKKEDLNPHGMVSLLKDVKKLKPYVWVVWKCRRNSKTIEGIYLEKSNAVKACEKHGYGVMRTFDKWKIKDID